MLGSLRSDKLLRRVRLVSVFDQALGLNLAGWKPPQLEIPAAIQALAEARWQARSAKNWAEADRLRQELLAQGWAMLDGKEGYRLEKT
jgi:cysteinyl-tRNA synthetase (EC 6.1.1.16)